MGMSMSIGLSGKHGRKKGLGGRLSNLFDADYERQRFRFDGIDYASEAAFNLAAGIFKSGEQRTIGPYVDPAAHDLMPEGYINNGINVFGATHTVVGDEAVAEGNGNTNPGVAFEFPSELGRAYRVTASFRRVSTTSSVSALATTAVSNTALGSMANNTTTVNVTRTRFFAAEGTTTRIASRSPNAGVTGTFAISGISVHEAMPFKGFHAGALALLTDFIAPASLAGDQALFEANASESGAGARDMIKGVMRASDAHLIVTVSFGNAAAATLDLGAVVLGGRNRFHGSFATNRFVGQLNDNAAVVDTLGTYPGVSVLYFGRGQLGTDNFTGTFLRTVVFDGEYVPDNTLSLEGDSFGGGAGGAGLGISLAAAVGTGVVNTAEGGSTMQAIADRLVANPGIYRGDLVICDGSQNGYTNVKEYFAPLVAALAVIKPKRFVIVTAVIPFGGGPYAGSQVEAIRIGAEARFGSAVVDYRDWVANTNGIVNEDRMLNYPTDSVHLNATAHNELATGVLAKIA